MSHIAAMKGYGQFCPIAKATELLAERWTLLVVRELLFGSRRYNDLRRGLPRISPTLLAQRLQKLVEAGVIEHRVEKKGCAGEYHLTQAGTDLGPLMDAMAIWAHRWAASELPPEDLDPRFLMWAIHRNLKIEYLPSTRTVIYVEFSDRLNNSKRWWLVVENGEVDLCWRDPGHDIHLCIYTDVLTLTRLFECQLSLADATSKRLARLEGSRDLIQSMAKWFGRPAERHMDSAVHL